MDTDTDSKTVATNLWGKAAHQQIPKLHTHVDIMNIETSLYSGEVAFNTTEESYIQVVQSIPSHTTQFFTTLTYYFCNTTLHLYLNLF